ncbi:FtsW/RodA/SpoVE family cell cycle protein [Schnuerera sp.]|uniref:FtsW/RodA/SpoVE family cell cycle protein n=1 Tax=Schnuerera sp. TaxID=2794844 RepID=UPI002B8451B1|nr:FtsW/RodA/SpoVE family cell cycle protein [Schnuerera sp.]HSH36680.1 FtsW/RodA/SpoVE family cell cycle protein [Schnuerera sp.]
MQYSAKINEFLETICEQIRWKKAHNMVCEEIRNHIIDQKNAFINEGIDEETALDKAIKEMGDPVLIGTELDRTHRPKTEWKIILLTGIMILLGFTIRFIASSEPHTPLLLERSLITTLIGIVFMVTLYFTDFTIIGRYPKTIFIGITIISMVSMVLSPVVRGKHAYVQFIMILFPTVMSGIIYNMRTKGYLGIILSGAFFIIPVFIGFMIPSISVVVLIFSSFLILITMAIIKGWFNVNKLYGMLLVSIPTIVIGGIGFIKLMFYSYRRERLLNIINPLRDPLGHGYIGAKMRDMLAGAKFIGRGTLEINSYMIPEINTNYILTYLIHRLGWLSFIVVMGVIFLFIFRSFKICYKQKSILGKLVSTAVLITFTMEVVFYTISNLGFPITNYVLPFISYSGMATIVNMSLIGIMLSVFKSGYIVKDSFISKNDEMGLERDKL